MILKKLWSNLMVADVNKTIDFYTEVLGFHHVMSVPMGSEQVLFEYKPNQPFVYALIRHGEIEIMLQEQKSLMENVPGLSGLQGIHSSAVLYFEVDDVVALAAKLKQHCTVVRDLHDTFYGMKEIYIKDINGYVLGFAQPQS